MIRKIITIDEEKCNGCGLCAEACHEGAIGMENGVAKLLRDDYCDGLGDCLPICPTGAISFVEREAAAYDETAVMKNMKAEEENKEALKTKGCSGTQAQTIKRENNTESLACGCPGELAQEIIREKVVLKQEVNDSSVSVLQSQLNQWPVQIKLAPVNAPYFNGADLLIAADCTAYAYGNFHDDFIKNKVTLVGCPKLDAVDYGEKLTEILKLNDVKSITVVRMEVPCCTGIVSAVKNAMKNSEKIIPWQIFTISTDGKIVDNV
jgi:Fe-S-cluster-containing hydrogenase component 2